MNKDVLQRALEKLDREAEGGKAPLRSIEEMMRTVCSQSEAACLAVLAEDKTLGGAYDAMYRAAKERKGSSSCVCIGPDEASRIVLDYYGINSEEPIGEDDAGVPEANSQTPADSPSDVVDLFDLL